jgi:hypothetical protein
MQLQPFPIAGGSYADDSKPYDSQDCVNFLPEGSETSGSRSQMILRGVPGMEVVATFPGIGGGRGLRNVNGQLYAVQGSALYSVSPVYATTSLGFVDGTKRVSMSHNQVASGNQVTVVTGPLGYVWNSATSTFTQISSAGFVGSSVTSFVDQYTLQLDPLGKYWYVSDIADSLTYQPVNQFQAEADPDIISTLIVSHGEVWAMGPKTIQKFHATGALDILFATSPGTLIEIGMGGQHTAAVLDNTVYWLGSDGIVYFAAGGYLPERVSTFAVEQDIKGKDWSQAYAMTWVDNGHKVFYLTFPDGHTWGYDVSQKLWHRRESYGLDIWRANHLEFWNGAWHALDIVNGNLYRLGKSVHTEAGAPLVSRRITPALQSNEQKLFLSMMQLYVDCGRGPLVPDAQINMRYSDDGGFTWSNWKQQSVNSTRNNQSRVIFRRLGTFRDRVFDIVMSGDCRHDIIAGYIQMAGQQ